MLWEQCPRTTLIERAEIIVSEPFTFKRGLQVLLHRNARHSSSPLTPDFKHAPIQKIKKRQSNKKAFHDISEDFEWLDSHLLGRLQVRFHGLRILPGPFKERGRQQW
jgi:hypothetical protein